MKKFIPQIVIASIMGAALSGVSAMPLNSFPQTPSESGSGAAARVSESGSIKHAGMIAFVVDSSAAGRAFEHAYFGNGGQAVYAATTGMYVQIVSPRDIPGGPKVGSVVALSPDGTEVIATLKGRPTLSEIHTFSEWVKGMLIRREAEQLATRRASQDDPVKGIAAPNVTESRLAKIEVAPIRPEPKNLTAGDSKKNQANPEVAVSSTSTNPTEFGPCGNVDVVYTCSPE